MPRTATYLITLLGFALLGAIVFLLLEQERKIDALEIELANGNAAQKTHADRSDRRIGSLSLQLDQHASILHQAVGSVIPMRVPPEIDQRLADIETLIINPNQWPTHPDEVAELHQRVDREFRELPPWVQEALLPRVTLIDGALSTLWLMAQPEPEQVVEAVALLQPLRELSAREPTGPASDALAGAAAEYIAKLEARIPELAKRELDAALANGGDVLEALALIEYLDEEAARNAHPSVERLVNLDTLDQALDALASRLQMLDRLEDEQLAERIAASLRDHHASLQLEALALQPPDATADARLASLKQGLDYFGHRAEARAAASVANYQQWALTQIGSLKPLAAIERTHINKIPSALDRRNRYASANVNARAAAMEHAAAQLAKQLASIDTRLLDEAVATRYRMVFQSRFAELDEPHQLMVVEHFAKTAKRPLGSALE